MKRRTLGWKPCMCYTHERESRRVEKEPTFQVLSLSQTAKGLDPSPSRAVNMNDEEISGGCMWV
jgi:hypothetical protein